MGKHWWSRNRKQASGDTTASNLQRSSRSPPPPPTPDIDSLTSSRNTAHERSEAEEHPSQSCRVPLIGSKTCSTSDASQPLREQGKQSQTLWEEAANTLDLKDREKLDGLIQSKRRSQTVDPIPEGQRGGSPEAHVNFVLSSAQEVKEKDKAANWRPVSSIKSQNTQSVCSIWILGRQRDYQGSLGIPEARRRCREI
jgi:hypothetical protein